MAEPLTIKNKISKRSSNSYSNDEWRRHRPIITQLYFDEGRTLKEVREYLKDEFDFAPTERMYKSRLHTWGLDKKKKEHEMLDLVRQGLQQKGDDKDKVFLVRGRQVTLADALHYFNRKGIKDPSTLLEPNTYLGEPSNDVSSGDDFDVQTPSSSQRDCLDASNAVDSDYDPCQSPSIRGTQAPPRIIVPSKMSPFAEEQLASLQQYLKIPQWQALPKFQHAALDVAISSRAGTHLEQRYLNGIYTQAKEYFTQVFSARDFTVGCNTWSATSDEGLADRFYYSMYHGFGFLWSSQRDQAFEEFYKAFNMIQQLLQEHHVGFLIYLFDLIIRHDGTGHEEPLQMLLKHIADMASATFGNSHPMYLIASWLRNPEGAISRTWIAESVMRKLLAFFSDSIGYFHSETIALLQTFATGLLNAKHYQEAAARSHQLVDAFETIQSEHSYEVCYALRTMSEAYFHAGMFIDSAQVLKVALDRSVGLPREEEREIHVRCFRAFAEIWNKVGQREKAAACMQYVVECCIEAWGPEHKFVSRARAHQKSLRDGESNIDGAIPPMVYRLGRGGAAAKMIWTTRSSPLRLQA